jgi:hypothetical protein
MLYARKINRRINSGIYLGPTQGLSSPKSNRQACLCTKTNTYSRKCCNGDLIAQGIGNITGVTTIAPLPTTTTTIAPNP